MRRRQSRTPTVTRLMLAALLPLSLSGCAMFGGETPLPETRQLIGRLPTVENSTQSPCWQQRQIAAQRSYVDTVKTGKTVVWGAPCDVDKKPAQSRPAEVKTS